MMENGQERELSLEAPMAPMAIIRTTFEILGEFLGDAVLAQDMANQIRIYRKGLVANLASLRDAVREGSLLEHTDFRELKASALRMVERGWNGLEIDRLMKTDAFAEDLGFDEPLFFVERYRDLPPRAFAAMLMEDIRAAAEADGSYISRSVFDGAVYRRYTSFLFLCYSATDPVFYGRP